MISLWIRCIIGNLRRRRLRTAGSRAFEESVSTTRKVRAGFPAQAIRYCPEGSGLTLADIVTFRAADRTRGWATEFFLRSGASLTAPTVIIAVHPANRTPTRRKPYLPALHQAPRSSLSIPTPDVPRRPFGRRAARPDRGQSPVARGALARLSTCTRDIRATRHLPPPAAYLLAYAARKAVRRGATFKAIRAALAQ